MARLRMFCYVLRSSTQTNNLQPCTYTSGCRIVGTRLDPVDFRHRLRIRVTPWFAKLVTGFGVTWLGRCSPSQVARRMVQRQALVVFSGIILLHRPHQKLQPVVCISFSLQLTIYTNLFKSLGFTMMSTTMCRIPRTYALVRRSWPRPIQVESLSPRRM